MRGGVEAGIALSLFWDRLQALSATMEGGLSGNLRVLVSPNFATEKSLCLDATIDFYAQGQVRYRYRPPFLKRELTVPLFHYQPDPLCAGTTFKRSFSLGDNNSEVYEMTQSDKDLVIAGQRMREYFDSDGRLVERIEMWLSGKVDVADRQGITAAGSGTFKHTTKDSITSGGFEWTGTIEIDTADPRKARFGWVSPTPTTYPFMGGNLGGWACNYPAGPNC